MTEEQQKKITDGDLLGMYEVEMSFLEEHTLSIYKIKEHFSVSE